MLLLIADDSVRINKAIHAVGNQAANIYLNSNIMSKVKLGWSTLTIPQKLIKAGSVITTMAANADVYVTPDPPLGDIETAIDALIAAQTEAIKGGVDRTVVRNARLDELTDLMNTLVDYVQLTSGGNAEKIAKAGMEVRKASEPWPVPDRVTNLQALPGGNPGTIELSWDAVRYQKQYVVEMFVDGGKLPPSDPTDPTSGTDTGAWEVLVIQGKRTYTAIGLQSGTQYRFRVAAINSTGMGTYSEEAQSVAS